MSRFIIAFKSHENELVFVIGLLTTLMGHGLIMPFLSLYANSFNISFTVIGFLFTGFGVARAITDIPAASLADRYGRRIVLMLGFLIVAVASILCAFANSFYELIIFWSMVGIGSALYTTSTSIMFADLSTKDNRGRLMSVYSGIHIFASSIGALIGGFIVSLWGYRAPFFFYAFFAIIAMTLMFLKVKETRARRMIGKIGMHVNEVNSSSRSNVLYKRRQIFTNLFTNTSFLGICLATFVIFFIRQASRGMIIPLFASGVLHLSEVEIGFALSIGYVIQGLLIFPAGFISDKLVGRKIVIIAGLALSGVAILLFTVSEEFLTFSLASALLGFGMGSSPLVFAYTIDIVPKTSYGIALGTTRFIGDVGIIIGPVLLGIISEVWGVSAALYLNGGLILFSAILFQLFAKNTRKS